ncbi:MAG: caspase family protein [Verrucomicrobia bacterium]|nr:caspase family protein [Verrucomicrobiota bacterium]
MKMIVQRILLTAILLMAAACDRPEADNTISRKPANPAEQAASLKCHALVIGISDYAGTGWPALGTARADAEAIGDVLEKQYGFHVVKLLDHQATRPNILRVLDSLMDFGPNDALLIYFAGHGFYDEQMAEGYWIPFAAARSRMEQPAKEDWLWNTSINRVISASPARHILLIADTCYGGSLFRGDDEPSKSSLWYRRAMAIPSRYLITSGNLEPVLDSGIRHSVFAQEILNHLQYADQEIFSASDLGIAIRQKVSRLTGQLVRMGPLATPSHAGGEFVFVRKDDAIQSSLPAESISTEPVFRSAELLPKSGKNNRLQQLVDQIEKYSGEEKDVSFVRPRILACLGPTGRDLQETTLVRNRLRESLDAMGGCVLVEREAFDDVLREVELSHSSLADSRVAMHVGKLLPASLILFGEIIPMDGENEIHLRIVDTETSRVLISVSHPFSNATDLPEACRSLATSIMTTVNQARPLLLPARLTPEGMLQVEWGRFHGARVGETFEIITRDHTNTVSPRETEIGTASLLSMNEERAILKAEWNSIPTNPPTTMWLKAQLR